MKTQNQFLILLNSKNSGNILLLLLVTLFFSCSTKKMSVNYSYSNVKFTPGQKEDQIASNFSVLVQPIDAQDINEDIAESLRLDGGYEQESVASQFYEVKDLTVRQKRAIKRVEAQYRAMDEMVSKDIFNSIIANIFKQMIADRDILNQANWFDGSETLLISPTGWFASLNPYRIDNRYLSLFRITFNNKSEEIQEVNLENIQVSNGTELLYPFKTEYFESVLKDENEKMKYIHRMNMPNRLRVLPDQQVQKFISTPAVGTYEELMISFISDNTVVNYPFSAKLEQYTEKHNYTGYSIPHAAGGQYFIIELPSGVSFPIKGRTLYINDQYAAEDIKLFSISVRHSNSRITVSYGELSFVPSKLRRVKITPKYNGKIKISY